jgi:hypothetical protein
VALGQAPNLGKCQEVLHLQLTGAELSPELSADERRAKLRQAMAGLRLLLVFDDLWEAAEVRWPRPRRGIFARDCAFRWRWVLHAKQKKQGGMNILESYKAGASRHGTIRWEVEEGPVLKTVNRAGASRAGCRWNRR